MTIAYLLDTFPSLTETFIAREIAALRRRGFSLEIFAFHAGAGASPIAPSWPLRARGAAERLLSGGQRPRFFRDLGAAWWRDAGRRGLLSGVSHIHAGWASHPADVAWGAAEAARLPWSFSGHARDLFVDARNLEGKLVAARFAAACTRTGQQWLQQQAPQARDKIHYMPHGIDTGVYEFREHDLAEQAPAQRGRLLAVGRLVEKKGLPVLLDALALLHRDGQPWNAVIIGDGPLRGALQRQCERLSLTEVVELRGSCSPDEVRSAMYQAGCFVLPCVVAEDGDRDGLPNVLLEAAACGLPVVSTPVGGVSDFVDASTGILCPAHDAPALAAALSEVFAHPEATRDRCRAARRRVEEQFDIERNIERLATAFTPGL